MATSRMHSTPDETVVLQFHDRQGDYSGDVY